MAIKARPFCFANVVNRANVGMVERGRGLGFALKSRERLWIFGYIVGQELQRDKAMQPYVLGLVHHTHAAAAQLGYDAVVRNCLVDHVARILRC